MKTVLFFLSIITCACPIYASQEHKKKPTYRNALINNNQQQPDKQKQSITSLQKKNTVPGSPFPYNWNEILPVEIQNIIADFATNNTSAKKLPEAVRNIKALLITNKYFYKLINKPLFSDNLIKDLSLKYVCSHESVAKKLNTPHSKQRLALQQELKTLCRSEEDDNSEEKLNSIIARGGNLEFTYNHGSFQKTSLMMSMSYDNKMFDYLINYGANINGTNAAGTSVLQMSLNNPDYEMYALRLITHPKIALEQKNNRGETALLYCIISKRVPGGRFLNRILKALINSGANPNPSNKKASALAAAERLCSNVTIRIIKRGIAEQRKAIPAQ